MFASAIPVDALHAQGNQSKDLQRGPSTVTISATPASVTEGEAAQFTVVRTNAPGENDSGLWVNLWITNVGDFLPKDWWKINEWVFIGSGATSVQYSIPTVDDQSAEDNGSITVGLRRPQGRAVTNYRIGMPDSATVAVLDNELPLVSLAAVAATVTEGTSAEFRIIRTGSDVESLSVQLNVFGHAKMMSDATRQLQGRVDVTLDAGMDSATLALTTEADNYNEGDGEIGVSIRTSQNYQIGESSRRVVLVEDDDIPEVTLEWVSPPMTLEGNVWVGEMYEGLDIFYQVNCSGDSIAPPVDVSLDLSVTLRFVTHHQEILNHPRSTLYGNDTYKRFPCAYDAIPDLYTALFTKSQRFTGADNGEIRIDLDPQRASLPGTNYFNSKCNYGLSTGTSVEERFCPKYTIGAVSSARITVLNRNPTITIEAHDDVVVEGEAARFTITRHWVDELLHTVEFGDAGGGTTGFKLNLETNAGYSQYAGEHIAAFRFGVTEIPIEVLTRRTHVAGGDREVTVEILPGSAWIQAGNVDGHYEVADELPGITPPGKSARIATVRVRDADTRGIVVTPTSVTVPEGGDSTYTVVLGSQPTGTVTVTSTVTPSVGGNSDVTVNPSPLHFTPSDWNQVRTVTVSAGHDVDAEPDTATVSHAVSGADYGSVAAEDVVVTVNDDDTASTMVELTVSIEKVEEGAGAASVTVTGTLNEAPRASATTVTVSVGAPADAATQGTDYVTVAEFALTIDAELTSGTATFTLTPVDDDLDEEDEALAVAGTTTVPNLNVTGIRMTIADDDTRGVEVTPTSLTVPEGSDSTYTVVLESEPTGSVTVTPSVGGNSDVTVSPSPLTFTPSDWNEARTVTVSAVDDVDAQPDTAMVSHVVSGADYGSVAADDVAVTVADDDSASTTVELAVSLDRVEEGAGATSVTVTGTLDGAPRVSATTVTVSVGALADAATQVTDYATVAQFPLTIDADLARGTATFTLTPVDDDLDEEDESMAVSGSTTVAGLDVTGTTVTIADDDTRAVEVTPTSLTVPEGSDSTYTVVLESEPTGPVTVTPTVGDNSDVTVSPSPLTFAPSDWNEVRTVTVSAVDDVDAQPDTATVIHAVSGADYGSVLADDVAVTVAEDDVISTTVELTVSIDEVEEGAGATPVTVMGTLNGAPRVSATLVTVSVGAPGDAATEGTDYVTVAQLALTIDAGLTGGTATFTLTPADDDLDEEVEELTVAGTTTAPNLGVTRTTVTIADDDTRGVEVTPTSLTVPEGGDSTYTVVLESEPTGSVTVTSSVGNNLDVTVFPSFLTFTPSDWDQAQTVTVTAGHDGDAEADTATVSHTVSGAGYGSVLADDVAVTVTDDSTASTTIELTVSIVDVEEGAGATSVTVTGTLNEASRLSATLMTVSVGVTADAATVGTDYETVAQFPLTIDEELTSGTATFTLTPVDDDLDEDDEALTVAGTTLHSNLDVIKTTVTIADDDTRGVEVTPTSLTVPEGSDSTYTVVLESEPTGSVTVTPTVGDNSDVTVSPSPLTFTPSDWNEARTVTVSAVDDVDAEPDTAMVSHAVSGADYGSVAADDVAVTVAEDESASTIIELTVSIDGVEEGAGATSVTVTGTLNGAPRLSVTLVTVSVGVTADAATVGTDYAPVAQFPLAIDAGLTSGTATFTLTPADDDLDEEDEALTVVGTTTVPNLNVTGIRMTIADDDTRGVEVTPTSLTVPEGSDSTYTVVLESEPTGSVTVTPSVGGNSDVTVSPSPLTFTPSDWNEARTVTVSAVDDVDAQPDTAMVSHAVSGADYGSVLADDVAVTVADDESASTIIELAVSLDRVEEGAGATSVTVTGTLNEASRLSATLMTVSVGVTADAATVGTDYETVAQFPLTIDEELTSGTATFTLTPVDDDLDEDDEALTVAGTTLHSNLDVIKTTVTIADDDTRGVEVTPTSLTVPEGSDSTYTVVLESEPTGSVTVTPTVGDNSDVTVSPSPLTFTPSDWNEARTVTVSAVDDVDAQPDTAMVSHAVSGADYGSVLADDVAVTVAEDESASTIIELTVSLDGVEEGVGATSVTVTGTLNGAPRLSVTLVTVSVGAPGDAATQGTDYVMVAGFPLTIDAELVSGTATFTLTPVDDDLDEEDEALTVSGSTMVAGLGVTGTTLTIVDIGTRGIVVTPTSLTVPEGSDSTYTVVLESRPAGPVTVTPTVGDNSDVTVSPSPLTFTRSDWNQARTVTVSAGHDVDAEPDTATVSHAVSGADYGSVAADDVAVTVADGDSASTAVWLTVSIEKVEEHAGATSVTVTGTLNEAPRAAATVVTVSVGAPGDAATQGTDYATVAALPLTIDAGRTSGTATFTLTPVDDDIDEDDEALTVSGTTLVAGLGVTGTTVTIVDNDTRGVVVIPTSVTVPEGGDSTYTVVLESEPTGPVTVTPSVGDNSDVTVGPSPLTFTPSDWDAAQTVTVSAGHDVDAEPDTATVSHAVSGADYESVVTADDVAVAVTDDDTASTRVTLAVNPESVDESAGETSVVVTGTLDEAPRTYSTMVTVSVGAPGDTAIEGTDYSTVDDFTLAIAANEVSGTETFMLTPLDDPVDEERQAITVSGTTRDLTVDAATLTIVNDDPLPRAWLARFGRTVADQVIDAVQSRMEALHMPGAQATLSGQPVGAAGTFRSREAEERLAGWFAHGTDSENHLRSEERELTAHEMLTDTSFALTEGTQEAGYLTFWGRGAASRFDGRVGALSLDGEVMSAMLGTDWAHDDWTAGLIVSHSRGEGGYRMVLGSGSGPGGSGEIDSSLTGVYPWGRYETGERVTFWGVAGYGEGALTLRTGTGATYRTDMDLAMAATGLRGVLVEAPAAGGLNLAVKTDSLVVRTRSDAIAGTHGKRIKEASAEVTRVRLGLEGSRPVHFEGDAMLTPSMEIGVRHDGGDAETGFGMDLGGGLAYADPASGLTAELWGRGLLIHAAPAFRERGISGSLGFDPTPDSDRGPAFTLRRTMGASATGGMDGLLRRDTLTGRLANDDGNELARQRFDVRLGYGLAAYGDRFTMTPEIGYGMSETGRDWSLGWRLTPARRDRSSFELKLEATRREHDDGIGAPEHGVGLRLTARW